MSKRFAWPGAVLILTIWTWLPAIIPLLPFPIRFFWMQQYRWVCHQIEDRCFYIQGLPFAVCHRCFGIYLGIWIASFGFPLLKRYHETLMRSARLVVGIGLFPLVLDWLLGVWGVWSNGWESRFLTGIMAGLSTGYYVTLGLTELLHEIGKIRWSLLFHPKPETT